MTTVVVIAHGNSRSGSFSNPNIKIITKANEPLSFDDARSYLGGNQLPRVRLFFLGRLRNA
ncbi:hypothetical protein CTA1_11548 [Colletotrichum tanaceti]|uniref:Uncharacterized protein n=1 Tax=Colletotrichum tanaceti TaxID=1306861 RepID=A0A4U6XQ13_9PEZI|nr:hypothetical protein CTA1_11548 [Colletotrichum tanaceti]